MTIDILSRDRLFFERLSVRLGRQSELAIRLSDDIESFTSGHNPLVIDITKRGGFEPDGLPLTPNLFLGDETQQKNAGGVPIFKKYSSVSALERIFTSLFQRGDETKHKGGCRTVLFSSPAGGSGATVISAAAALAAAELCENDGKRAFYLSLEPVPAESLFRTDDGPALDSILFALNSRCNSAKEKIVPMFAQSRDGVDFIRPPAELSDVSVLTPDNLNTLISVLRESGRYSYIAVDCPFSFGSLFITAEKASDEVFLIENGDKTSRNKLEKVLKNGSVKCGIIRNRCREKGVQEAGNVICIPEIKASDAYEITRQTACLLKHTKAVYVRKENVNVEEALD